MTDVSFDWGWDGHIHVEASSFFTFGTGRSCEETAGDAWLRDQQAEGNPRRSSWDRGPLEKSIGSCAVIPCYTKLYSTVIQYIKIYQVRAM